MSRPPEARGALAFLRRPYGLPAHTQHLRSQVDRLARPDPSRAHQPRTDPAALCEALRSRVDVLGHTMSLHQHDSAASPSPWRGGPVKPPEGELLLWLAREGKTALDLGATSGPFTVLARKVGPLGKVFAFEPDAARVMRFSLASVWTRESERSPPGAPSMSPVTESSTTPAVSQAEQRRIRIGASCADCDPIPKVPGAGETFDGPGGRCQRMHNGVQIAEGCYCGAWMTELIRQLRGHHEPQEERAFHALLGHVGDGGTMLELGSFWGYYSMWFQKAVPGATNYLVEPDPHNLEVGRHNFALNGMTGRFTHAAVGRTDLPPRAFWCESDRAERPVPTLSVDGLVRREGIGRVDLLLSDIQGAELEMLEGAAGSIEAGVIRFVVVSTHHHAISGDPLTHQKCLRFLLDRKAHVLAEHSVSESYSGDGLIVAALRPEDRHLPRIAVSRNHAANSLFGELEYDLADARQDLASARARAAETEQQLAAVHGHLAAVQGYLDAVQRQLVETEQALAALGGHPVVRALRFVRHPLRAVKRRLWPAA